MIRHLLLAAVLCITTTGNFAHAAEATLKALIIDGQNNHDWVKTTPVLKEMLEKCGRFTVEVATSPQGKADEAAWAAYKPAFDKYDVVVSNYNGRAWAEPTKAAFLKYVADGGGVVMIHAANNAFQGWTEYDKMIGLGWRDANYGEGIIVDADGKVVRRPKGQGPGAGHGAKYPFLVTTRDAEHPVMKGLPKAWMHAEDELYHGQRGPAENMTVLATAMSDKTKGGTGDNEPCLLYTSPSPRDRTRSRMPSSA